jgi:TatD DNase family protein
MRLIDSHAHLDSSRFDGDRDAVIARAPRRGVRGHRHLRLRCGELSAASHRARRGSTRRCGRCGIHPHEAQHAWSTREAAHVEAAAATWPSAASCAVPAVVAIGEIGLDYHYDFSPRPEVQRAGL